MKTTTDENLSKDKLIESVEELEMSKELEDFSFNVISYIEDNYDEFSYLGERVGRYKGREAVAIVYNGISKEEIDDLKNIFGKNNIYVSEKSYNNAENLDIACIYVTNPELRK